MNCQKTNCDHVKDCKSGEFEKRHPDRMPSYGSPDCVYFCDNGNSVERSPEQRRVLADDVFTKRVRI